MGEIRDFVMAEPLFDNHEHQNGFGAIERARETLDYTAFLGYAHADIATASPLTGVDCSDPDAFFDTWRFVRTTGYGQGTEIACKALLGVDFVRENVEEINQALRDFAGGRTGAEIYEKVYGDANICGAVCDCCWDSPTKLDYFSGAQHPESFGQALRYDGVIALSARGDVERFERTMDCSIQRLSDLDRALDDYTSKARAGGKLVAMKCGLAYLGTLRFENSSYVVAEPIFERVMRGEKCDVRPLTEYLFHRFVQRAREFSLPVQIHTGYLAGNWQDPSQGDPTPLADILRRYRSVRFDMFHAGWPHTEVACALGKVLPNVYLDLCWAWAMNPTTMRRALDSWLSAVPHNKIFGFGADTGTPYVVPGYALQARNGIASVLEAKIDRGEYDLPTARDVARRILHENAQEFYGL
jgi:uncharacterized protein